MQAVLLDTDVVSYLLRGDRRAKEVRQKLQGKFPVISFMTVAEMERWALARNWGADRRAQLDSYLSGFPIYPFNLDLCRLWAEVTVHGQRMGRLVSCADAWIAASALVQEIPLLTNNRAHFEGIPRLQLL